MSNKDRDDQDIFDIDDSIVGVDDDEIIDDEDGLLDDDDDLDGDDGEDGNEDDGENADDDDDDDRADPNAERLAALEAQVSERNRKDREEAIAKAKQERVAKEQSLSNEISSLLTEIEAAKEKGETKDEMKLLEKLMDAKADLKILKSQPEPKLEDDGVDTGAADQKQQQLPERVAKRLKNWLDANPWFNSTDKKKLNPDARDYAIAVGNRLANEGYDPGTSAYYRELDKNLAKRFPEVKGGGKRRERPSSAPGGARPSAKTNAGGKRRVTITAEKRQMLDRFGLDSSDPNVLKQYARVQRGEI